MEYRRLWRFLRSPETIAEGKEDRHALRDQRTIVSDRHGRVLGVCRNLLSCPHRGSRGSEVIFDEATNRPQIEPLGVASGTQRIEGGTDADRAFVVRNLPDVVSNRTNRPLLRFHRRRPSRFRLALATSGRDECAH